MELLWLRITVAVAVVAVLSLYLYDVGAHRVYDIAISAVVLIVTSPLFGVLAAVCAAKNKKVFDRSGEYPRFTLPRGALCRLPFFAAVFVGKAHIMPMRLRVKKTDGETSEIA